MKIIEVLSWFSGSEYGAEGGDLYTNVAAAQYRLGSEYTFVQWNDETWGFKNMTHERFGKLMDSTKSYWWYDMNKNEEGTYRDYEYDENNNRIEEVIVCLNPREVIG